MVQGRGTPAARQQRKKTGSSPVGCPVVTRCGATTIRARAPLRARVGAAVYTDVVPSVRPGYRMAAAAILSLGRGWSSSVRAAGRAIGNGGTRCGSGGGKSFPQSSVRAGNASNRGGEHFMEENFVLQSGKKNIGNCFSIIKNISYVLYKTVDCAVKALYTDAVGRRKSGSSSLLFGSLTSP